VGVIFCFDNRVHFMLVLFCRDYNFTK
jgi:hypothetical protein